MKITNKLNLPQPLVEMAQSNYTPTPKRYSVSNLLKPVRQTLLERRHHNEITVDVADMIWALRGQATHKVLEQYGADNQLKEEYITMALSNGYTVSGRFDLYVPEEKAINDWKDTSVWRVVNKNYEDEYKQLLYYGIILQTEYGFEVKRGKVTFLLRDHNLWKALYEKDYPKHPVHIVTFDFSPADFKRGLEEIEDKIAEFALWEKASDNDLPICTPEERYYSGDTFAVKKKNIKKALRVLNSMEEAEAWIEKNEKGDFIEERKGINKKCIGYCRVKEFCNYYLENIKNKEVSE